MRTALALAALALGCLGTAGSVLLAVRGVRAGVTGELDERARLERAARDPWSAEAVAGLRAEAPDVYDPRLRPWTNFLPGAGCAGAAAGAVLGAAGCLLLRRRWGLPAGMLLALGFLVPYLAVSWWGHKGMLWEFEILVFNFGLALAAPVALFVWPHEPPPAPPANP